MKPKATSEGLPQSITVMPGTEQIVDEPDWPAMYEDATDIASATEYWHVLATEMRKRGILAAVNKHTMIRLVCAWIAFDNAHWLLVRQGAILKAKHWNKKASSRANPIPRVNPAWGMMKEASVTATQLEAELGLSPNRRDGAAQAFKQSRVERMSDKFLKRAG